MLAIVAVSVLLGLSLARAETVELHAKDGLSVAVEEGGRFVLSIDGYKWVLGGESGSIAAPSVNDTLYPSSKVA